MSAWLSQAHTDDAPRLELERGWQFLPDLEAKFKVETVHDELGWRNARVGIGWNAQFDDLRDFMGVGWYRIRVDIPHFSEPRHVLLKFGAVDYFAEVFVNGTLTGSHEGGYTPFTIDITGAARPGMNEITVRVIDPPMDERANLLVCPEMMYHEIPHGKQNWYVQNAGIWQGVRLEFCPAIYIDSIRVTPNVSGEFRVDVGLAGSGLGVPGSLEHAHLNFNVADRSGRTVLQESIPVVSREMQSFRGTIPKPKLWSPDDPSLYSIEIHLDGSVQYRKRVRFGFRKFEARDGKFFLNGSPFYMRGALDQDFYPETIHTPSSEDYVRDLMLKAKKLGINVLRCHLKIAHPVYLTVADEIGMLVWTEVPSWSDCWYPSDHFSVKAADRGRRMFEEMIERDWNHPSIIVQTIMNESWGIDLTDSTQRTWLKNTFNWVKEELNPVGRLVIDNSACEKNFHLKTDIEDFHNYYSMPDHVERWEKWTREMASRPQWTFSPYGDAERTGEEPIVVSEFGNWGLPQLPEDLPWWFSADFGGREATRPVGVYERFRDFGFAELFGDYNGFAEASQWHQYISLKHEIEDIRRFGEIQGYVITGMTDVHWEVNGLLDMWRNPKAFADELSKLQKDDLVLLDLSRYNFWSGEERELRVLLSHYSRTELSGAKVRWMTDSGAAGQERILADVAPGTVADIASLRLALPSVDQPTKEHLHLEVRSRTGALIAENTYELYVYPRVHVQVTLADLAAQQGVRLAAKLDDSLEAHIAEGARALIVIDDDDALPADFPMKVKERWGTQFDGRWFSNFNWVRWNAQPFDKLALNRILGFESAAVAPDHAITGIAAQDFGSVLAGGTFGWLQLNSAYAVPVRIGKGLALLTTFRFDEFGTDQYATHLAHALVKHASKMNVEALPALEVSAVTR